MSIQQHFSFLEEQVKLYTSLVQKENTNPNAFNDLNDRIIQCAQKILNDASTPEERLRCLSLVRNTYTNTYRITDNRLYLNLINRHLPPSEKCGTYPANLQFPFLSAYHSLNREGVLVRLDPLHCAEHIPEKLKQDLGGHIDPTHTDLFLVIDNKFLANCEHVEGDYYGGHYSRSTEELLVRFHRWAFPIQHSDDMKIHPLMGLYQPSHFFKAQHEPIAIDQMHPMCIHAHDNGLYSPNGSHIAVDRSAPYSAGWIACKDGDRVCIAKVICNTMRQDLNALFPSMAMFFSLQQGSKNLDDYLRKLERLTVDLDTDLHRLFDPIAEAISRGEPIKPLIDALPSALKMSVHKNIWTLKGSPHGIHNDFGRLSFEKDPSLDPKYRASDEEKIQAIVLTHNQIIKDIIEDVKSLLTSAEKTLEKPQCEIQASSSISSLSSLINELIQALSDPSKKLEKLHQLQSKGASTRIDEKKIEHRLFEHVYHSYQEFSDSIPEYKTPSHPDFGRAAFLGQDRVSVQDLILEIALEKLKSDLEGLK
jgi:hypothetical protein